MTPAPIARIAGLAPYALADLPEGGVSLAQNESLRAPSPQALQAAARALRDGALYPDPDWRDLREAIAEAHGLDPAAILCGAGSMELIGAIAAAYLEPGRRALQPAYGYAFFRTAGALAGAATDLVPERGFTADIDRLIEAASSETAVLWLANPGNPTGTVLSATEILRLREALPGNVLLVVDEAYGEFAEAGTVWPLVARGDTVVLRTFSKAYGLAGFRVGWGAFPPAVAREVRKPINPNNISAPAQAAAAAAMRDGAYMRETVAMTAALRDRLIETARREGLAAPESATNFALLPFSDTAAAGRAGAMLRAGGLLLRGMDGYGLPHCLRATVGREDAMAALGAALAEIRETEDAG
ncbi:MAG: histidinol-phosphate transaminase [Pseudomonadota bacterium]